MYFTYHHMWNLLLCTHRGRPFLNIFRLFCPVKVKIRWDEPWISAVLQGNIGRYAMLKCVHDIGSRTIFVFVSIVHFRLSRTGHLIYSKRSLRRNVKIGDERPNVRTDDRWENKLSYSHSWLIICLPSSVTRRKSPNVYKKLPKIDYTKKWKILTSLQNLPKNVGELGKLNVAKGLKKLPKSQKITKSGHTASFLPTYLPT